MSDGGLVELGDGRLAADLLFRGQEGLIASFFLPGPDGWAVVETGPTTCGPTLLRRIGEAGIHPGDVRRVFVSHIHLDHAGGVGRLAHHLPNATFYAHESGVPHLVDPSRLIASTRRAWGEAADPLWGAIVPLPAGRVVALKGGEEFALRGGPLVVLATPGHARHHLAYFDRSTGSLMTGDAAGVRLAGAWRPRPAIPPPDLDLEALFASLERMTALAPRRVHFTHFGESPDGARDLVAVGQAVAEWRDVALETARADPSTGAVATALRRHEMEAAAHAGGAVGLDQRNEMISGYDLAAQGLLRYFRTRGLLPD